MRARHRSLYRQILVVWSGPGHLVVLSPMVAV